MSPSLTPEQQNTLMAEFERGKASLLFNIALKVGPMRVPPLLVFGVAHFNRAKALDALRACLASDSTEGLMAELKSPVILAEARAFLEGDCLEELPSFCAFVGKLRFEYSVERGIEGEHASIHHFIRKAPNHTVAYVSLKRRMPQLQSHLINPQFLGQLSMFLEKVRNPKLAAHELGLRNHPALADDPCPWDPIFAKIVYRSDPVTTQAPSAPVEVRALPGAGPRRLGPQPQPIADSEASPAGGYLPEVVHQAALEHFRVMLQEECSDSGPDAGERAFSIFVSQAVMSAVFQVPAVQLPDSHAMSLPDLPHAPAVADSVVQQAGPSLAIQEQDSQEGLPESSLQQGSGSGFPDFFQDAIVQLRKPKDPNLPKAFAFKIVSLNPSQSKLPLQGTFQATDVGVSVLRTVALDTVKRLWVVDAEPLKLLPSANSASSSAGSGVSGSAQGSADICDIGPTVPIVFSPSSIPLEALMRVCVWRFHSDIGLQLDRSAMANTECFAGQAIPDRKHNAAMLNVLLSIQRSGRGGFCPSPDASVSQATCLKFLQTCGLVEQVPGSELRWCFSSDAKNYLSYKIFVPLQTNNGCETSSIHGDEHV